MDFCQLSQKYQQLLEENERLKKIIHFYEASYGPREEIPETTSLPQPPAPENPPSNSIHKHSPPEEKIAVFLSLFKGQPDVYAKRWQNQAGKSGYSPVCLNEWEREVCGKPKIKCSVCPHQNFPPFDAHAVDLHLRGRNVLGIFPLLSDNTCYFLAIDFDGEAWQADVSTLRKVCSDNAIPLAIERSRSGNGAHAWFFFAEPIDAALARNFGTALLTRAMMQRHQLRFSSYDRLFPNQDTLPKGGFGNLIALPLQKQAREIGNSVFIDENFQEYTDQWRFLNEIHRFSANEITMLAQKMSGSKVLGELRQEEEENPWQIVEKRTPLEKKDVPKQIAITKANMLYIHKAGFSEYALNRLKRLAAFKNPEFFKAQKMRLPTWNKPRIISLADESADFLHLPRGCEAEIFGLLSPAGSKIEWTDERVHSPVIEAEFTGTLRKEQADAAYTLLQHETGVLSATTAFGKTVVAAKLIAEREVRTLILVHTRQLLEQWQVRLADFLIVKTPEQAAKSGKNGRKKQIPVIGQIGGGKNKPSGIIDIAVMQSLSRGDEVKEIVRDYGMVIVDECHHVPAFSFEQILRTVRAKYVYGLTATPLRPDGHHPIIFMQCGPVRYTVDARDQAKLRPFEHFIIPRFTPFKMPATKAEKAWTIGEIYSALAGDHLRNQRIFDDVYLSFQEGRNPIILTQRTAHVETLAAMLKNVDIEVITLTGSLSAKDRREAMTTLRSLPEKSKTVIVATGKFVGEGFDEPRLDTLFLAMPIAWKGTVQQYAGRLHRLFTGKDEVQVYDYVDVHVGVLERMYQKRLRGYAAIGYQVKGDSAAVDSASTIFDTRSFFPVFRHDLQNARHDILIVSPFLRKNRLAQMLSLLVEPASRDVAVKIITRPADDFPPQNQWIYQEKFEMIRTTGAILELRPRIHQKFAIIDQRVVWYGSINLLSYGTSEESMMRIESVNIASELARTVGE